MAEGSRTGTAAELDDLGGNMKTNRFATRIAVVLLLSAIGAGIPVFVQAEDRLAHIFQDNMVLQREKPVPVWGWATPGTQVEVSFSGQKKPAQADEKGHWEAVLDPLAASREGRNLEVRIGDTVVSCKNVLVGEVWLAAGPSNTTHAIAEPGHGRLSRLRLSRNRGGKPEIRISNFGPGVSLEPLEDVDPAFRDAVPWKVLPEDPPPVEISPVCYFAGGPRWARCSVGDHPYRCTRDKHDFLHVAGNPGSIPGYRRQREQLLPTASLRCEGNLSKLKSGTIKSWADFKQVEAAWRETKMGPWPGPGQHRLVGMELWASPHHAVQRENSSSGSICHARRDL